MADEKIILDSDPEAATYRTDIKGWVSRDGMFYGDGPSNERTARYAGSTHRACDGCGKPTGKLWLKCSDCRAIIEREKYDAMPKAEWDGEAFLYSEARDRYFPDLEEASWALEDGETLADLMLVICKPNHVPELTDEYCADELPDEDHGDTELPSVVADAMEAFNKAVAGIVLSWSPSKLALKLPVAEVAEGKQA